MRPPLLYRRAGRELPFGDRSARARAISPERPDSLAEHAQSATMSKRDDDGGKPRDDDVNWGKFAGIGLQIAVGVALGYVIGHWLDVRYGWQSRGVVIGTMLGLAG